MKTYKIIIHDTNKVDLDNDKFTKQSTIFEDYKEFDSRHELKEWLLDYVEIIEMIQKGERMKDKKNTDLAKWNKEKQVYEQEKKFTNSR